MNKNKITKKRKCPYCKSKNIDVLSCGTVLCSNPSCLKMSFPIQQVSLESNPKQGSGFAPLLIPADLCSNDKNKKGVQDGI